MTHVLEESQGIIHVEVRPGETVKCRTIPMFRQITGRKTGTLEEFSAICASVLSEMPAEYQNDLGPFRSAVQAASRLKLNPQSCSTDRGTQVLDNVIVDKDFVFLDVTRCNHLPCQIYGSTRLQNESGMDVTANWVAVLCSTESVRLETVEYRQIRIVAKYLVTLA